MIRGFIGKGQLQIEKDIRVKFQKIVPTPSPYNDLSTPRRRNERSAGTYDIVDQLSYTYQTNSNKLTQVADAYGPQTYTAKDFKERSTVAYTYDANGNLKTNLDKQINNIVYNHLNIPAEVSFDTGTKIRFTYDAEGVKLSQKVYNTSGALTTTQDYIGEFVYQNGVLDYLIHEEGRIASESGGLFYEYYMKDHLGNVRQVLRNPTANFRIATMEEANAEEEESQFTQIKPTRKREPKHNITQGGQEVAWLNASRGEMVGPGTSQEIFEGDSVVLSVHGKYLDGKKSKISPGSFAASGGKSPLLDQLNELALNTSRAGGSNPIALLNLVDILAKDLQKKEVPEAYLIYALYDEDSNRYEVGKKILTRNAANRHEELEEKLAIKKNGYIETFVVNETGQDVWFDNFRVLSQGSLLVQETHYDPWGLELTGIGYEYAGVKKNKYLYQGKEMMDDHNLNIYDFEARGYDPVIGRTWQLDPHADKYPSMSPYSWVANNPILMIDPDGKDFLIWYTDDNGKKQNFRFTGSNADGAPKNEFVQQFLSAYNYNIGNGGGEKMQAIAENSKISVRLQKTEYETTHTGGVINWNPSLGAEYENGKTVSPATVLDHESDHANEFMTNRKGYDAGFDPKNKPDGFPNGEEKRVVDGSEQRTARANGEVRAGQVTRSRYIGQSIVTMGVTSNKKDINKSLLFHQKLKRATKPIDLNDFR